MTQSLQSLQKSLIVIVELCVPYKKYLNENLNNVEKKELLEDILKKFEDCAECFKEGDLPLGDLIYSHISEIEKEIERLSKK